MSHDEIDGDLGISRRQLIRRGAVVGGTVLWAAPVVQSLTTPALGQSFYPGQGCDCTATACALRITGALNVEECGSPGCVASIGVSGVTATALCATTEATAGADAVCNASASVATLNIPEINAGLVTIPAIAATVLRSSIAHPCDCSSGTAQSSVFSLSIGSTVVAVQAGGTVQVTVNGLTFSVTFNEVSCQNGVPTVRALHIVLAGLLDVVVAESAARGTTCPACT